MLPLLGEHIVFNVQKFAQEAAQKSDEPAVTETALDISKKAQRVTSIAKAATNSKNVEENEEDDEMPIEREEAENDTAGDENDAGDVLGTKEFEGS
ncbi:hypothetical protein, conserved [Eimeria maxima]|uniref:Uncharacterized protein n=1 Tax=Eimeria maxima TaxID=5804 RepID=U6M6U1_EIMMA|nr:hypothetical protein, conserved [Eimeria maxima]CDJ59942.1 hypothetical protein, conserved [Eimeria maxima]